MGMNTFIHKWNQNTEKWDRDQDISGTYSSYILDPDDANAANADEERIQDPTGFKAIRFTPLPGAIASTVAIIGGWSISAGDLTAVNVRMAALDVDITTPGGAGQANDDVGAMFPGNYDETTESQDVWTDLGWITWDGLNTIKTIAVRSTGANYTPGVLVETIR